MRLPSTYARSRFPIRTSIGVADIKLPVKQLVADAPMILAAS
jgi:hypothetical protein